MAYTITYDEKYFGSSSLNAAAYPDAPNSIGTSFQIAEGIYNAANGLLTARNFLADADYYSMGTLAKGNYAVNASNGYWFAGAGYSNYVDPVVTVYNSLGGLVAGGYASSIAFTVTSVNTYYIAVAGSAFLSSQYGVFYTYTAPVNNPASNGTLSIAGTLNPGNVLSLAGIFSDANGLTIANAANAYTYSWYVSLDNLTWTKVGNSATYLIGASDLGKYIYAQVAFVDDMDFPESVRPAAKLITAAVDSTPPTIALSSNKPSLNSVETATLNFTLSEPSTNFTATDITVIGGSLTNFQGSGTAYSATFTANANSTTSGVISVASGVFTDAAGNANADGSDTNNTLMLSVDTVLPTIAVSAGKASLVVGDTATLIFSLSKPSSNFVASDLSVTGGILSNFQGNGTTYTATFTPNSNSTANGMVSVASGVFSDAAGNANADGAEANNRVTFSVNTLTGLSLKGAAGNDLISGSTGNDTVDGGAGTDTMSYGGPKANYTINRAGAVITVNSGADGLDALSNVERIKFTDGGLALDLGVNQSTGQAALLLGAVLPGTLALDASKQQLMGLAISFFDFGYSLTDLAGAFLRLDIWSLLTGQNISVNAPGGRTLAEDTAIANYLLSNVNGAAPDLLTLRAAGDALHSEATQGTWLAQLALSSASQTHIGLVGLAATGVAYA